MNYSFDAFRFFTLFRTGKVIDAGSLVKILLRLKL